MRVWTAALFTIALAMACASQSGPSLKQARADLDNGEIEQAIEKLDQLRLESPRDAEVALELGIAYFRKARVALDAEDDEAYMANLAKAQDLVLTAVELDPSSSAPHIWMGIIAAYQSDLDRTLESLKNALRLEPGHPVHHSNLAEAYIYKGKSYLQTVAAE